MKIEYASGYKVVMLKIYYLMRSFLLNDIFESYIFFRVIFCDTGSKGIYKQTRQITF